MTRINDVRVTIGAITLYSNPPVKENFYLLLNPAEVVSRVSVDQDTVKKQGGHGVEPGLPSYGPRTLPFFVEIDAEDFDTLVDMREALEAELALPAAPSF